MAVGTPSIHFFLGHIKEIMEVKGKLDIIDIIEQKKLQRYGHVKRLREERIPKTVLSSHKSATL